MSESDLIARACETNAHYLALGNQRVEAHSALFIRNDVTPQRHDANCVGLIRTRGEPEVAALIAYAEHHYALAGHVRFDTDALTPPPTTATISLAGYRGYDETLVLILEGHLIAKPIPADIREVLNETDWATYRVLYELDVDEWQTKHGTEARRDPQLRDQFMASKRNKSPDARCWIAYEGGVAAAFLTSWPGENGVGIIEDLFTHPEYRHRGLATVLLAHCVTDARARGAGPVIINADPNDTPKQMYGAMGFRPLFLSRSFARTL